MSEKPIRDRVHPGKDRLFLSGPITNNPNYQKDFQFYESLMKFRGYTVINPAKTPMEPTEYSWEEFMEVAYVMLDMCDVIAMLPGFEQSKGSQLELQRATAKGLQILYL